MNRRTQSLPLILAPFPGTSTFLFSGTSPAQFAPAVKVIIFISLNVFGALGWWAGERFGIMTAWFLGGIGSVAGVYIGWLVARRYLE